MRPSWRLATHQTTKQIANFKCKPIIRKRDDHWGNKWSNMTMTRAEFPLITATGIGVGAQLTLGGRTFFLPKMYMYVLKIIPTAPILHNVCPYFLPNLGGGQLSSLPPPPRLHVNRWKFNDKKSVHSNILPVKIPRTTVDYSRTTVTVWATYMYIYKLSLCPIERKTTYSYLKFQLRQILSDFYPRRYTINRV